MILPLIGCDLLLDIQWLKTLGPITWDFQTLKMQFQHQNTVIILKGLKRGTIQLASKKQLARMYSATGKGTCTLLLTEQPTLQLEIVMKNKELTQATIRELEEVLH